MKDLETVTFKTTVKPKNERVVWMSYLLGVRDRYPQPSKNEDIFLDSGFQGATLFELGKPLTVFSAGNRSLKC